MNLNVIVCSVYLTKEAVGVDVDLTGLELQVCLVTGQLAGVGEGGPGPEVRTLAAHAEGPVTIAGAATCLGLIEVDHAEDLVGILTLGSPGRLENENEIMN